MRTKFARRAIATLALGLVASMGIVCGEDYPTRPIRLITSEAGGSNDLVSRAIATGISGTLGQQIVVDNRVGVVAVETVSKAVPDGYTLLFYGSPLWLTPLLRSNVSWSPARDFLPVTLAGSSPNILVVHPALPVKSVQELIALARAKPGDLNFSSGPVGGPTHLSGELLKSMAGVNMVWIPYKGSAAAFTALLSNQVQLTFASIGSVAPHLKSDRLKALAVTSAQPSPLLPGLPTVAASGLPGYESTSPYGLFAPAKTPRPIVDRLNRETVSMLKKPDVKERFFNAGIEIVGSTPEQSAATLKSETAKWGKLIKDAGIRAD